jgi:hypothetical protein
MADLDRETPTSTQPQAASAPDAQPQGQGGETSLSMALKAVFWFLILPAGVVLMLKWFLQV